PTLTLPRGGGKLLLLAPAVATGRKGLAHEHPQQWRADRLAVADRHVDRRVLAAVDEGGGDGNADQIGIHVAQILEYGLTDRGVGIALRVSQSAVDRPAWRPRTGRGLGTATGDIGRLLRGVTDFGRRQAEAQTLHAH